MPIISRKNNLEGVAAFLIWRLGLSERRVRVALLIFLIQLVLNALWVSSRFCPEYINMGIKSLIQIGQIFFQPAQGGFRGILFVLLATSSEVVLLTVCPAPMGQPEVK